MKLRDISARAAGLGEIAGLLGLYLSRQVEKPALLLPLLGIAVSTFLGLRLANRWLLLLVGLTAAASVTAGFMGNTENTVLLTRALLATHALLWCARDAGTYRFYRLGLAFLEVVLASILAPETYMLGLIFFFAVLSSLALAFGFIEANFARLDPAALGAPVKRSFLASLTGIAVLVFLSSLLIFPVLPRSNWEGRSLTETGYTELVSFRNATLGWAGENSRPVLWVFRPEKKDWPAVIPAGLLRAKVLESFDGTEWRPASKQFVDGAMPEGATPKEPYLFSVEIFREPLSTEVLPTPYGAAAVAEGERLWPRYGSGEFTMTGKQAKRVAYRVDVANGFGLPANDKPRPVHLRQASEDKFPRLKDLALELARTAKGEDEKVRAVTQYLINNYRAQQVGVASAESRVHPVEQFLFETKEGHCELFSTAAALLLREMGIPTRLVAGFRVPLPEESQVLTVRAAHAHAWIEVYYRGRWAPVDPTPRLLDTGVLPAFLTDAYDNLNAYWHRYILGYELDPSTLRGRAQAALPRLVEAAGAALLILFGWFLRQAWRAWRAPRDTRAEITRLYEKAATLPVAERRRLEERYEELRFGSQVPSSAMVEEFKRELKAARRSAA